MRQNYTSKNTSINAHKLPSIYSNRRVQEAIAGNRVIDIGGGKFDNATEYAKTLGADLQVYDKFNRTTEHNDRVLAGSYNVALCSNVLNVIDSLEARQDVIKLAGSKAPTIYFTVYEGDKTGTGRATGSDSYQCNRVTASYLQEIQQALGEGWTVERHGKLIECHRVAG